MTTAEAVAAWVEAWSEGWAALTTIAGTSMLRFSDDGLVTEHLDTWTEADGDLGITIRPEAPR